MSDYESLRRGRYQADAAAKAAQQEAADLGRDAWHPDAVAKAAQQEAYERREEASRRTAARGQAARQG
ncbi:MAG: hypothetical protein IJ203_14325, partial [Atopobiaceae bacterium]|nr:hypothetical protein [Atopobiaceae bacterium]